MFKKRLLFIFIFYANALTAQQFFLGEGGHHWIDYYVVEIKGDTAILENFEFYLIDNNNYLPIERLIKVNSPDTLFSNGKTKIISKDGKMWLSFALGYKRKLKDYSEKPEEIARIRKYGNILLSKNTVIAQLNQTLGVRNYDLRSIDEVERTISIETPRDSILTVFRIAADSIIAKEKAKVDFFKSFLTQEHLSETEIIAFLDSTNFSKQIEKDVFRKIIINDIEKLSQIVESQANKALLLKFNRGVAIIFEYSFQNKDCRKALKKSSFQSRTKRNIEKKMKRVKTKETLIAIGNITCITAFYGLLIKWIFF